MWGSEERRCEAAAKVFTGYSPTGLRRMEKGWDLTLLSPQIVWQVHSKKHTHLNKKGHSECDRKHYHHGDPPAGGGANKLGRKQKPVSNVCTLGTGGSLCHQQPESHTGCALLTNQCCHLSWGITDKETFKLMTMQRKPYSRTAAGNLSVSFLPNIKISSKYFKFQTQFQLPIAGSNGFLAVAQLILEMQLRSKIWISSFFRARLLRFLIATPSFWLLSKSSSSPPDLQFSPKAF